MFIVSVGATTKECVQYKHGGRLHGIRQISDYTKGWFPKRIGMKIRNAYLNPTQLIKHKSSIPMYFRLIAEVLKLWSLL